MMKPKAYKSGVKPIWCPGCGHYSVLNAITKALSVLEQKPEDCVLVSGIGCSSRLPAYANTYGFHGVHGRALPVATGIKVARPELNVIALGGDGDGFSIGGNHFLHACRRNVNFVYIAMDNEVYGMTKGQASPTTPETWERSKLTPHGTEVRPFQPCGVALASGASFIARAHSGDPNGMAKIIHDAILHPGFAFVHVLSQCITYCPEQQQWKDWVHDELLDTSDPATAASFLQQEDGFSKGIFYRSIRQVWPQEHVAEKRPSLRAGFSL
ncbi:MAG: 2-oxoacid:ferredoxin oxidoreductase subunit beta [Pseudomonadales bacterium]|nr:2-oxoacid:ferredoxin oxidoreductase subunit beta [Pseudomonadales bacterium]